MMQRRQETRFNKGWRLPRSSALLEELAILSNQAIVRLGKEVSSGRIFDERQGNLVFE